MSPLILLGGGAREAGSEICKLAEKLDAPVIMTVNARGIVPAAHPLAIGVSASVPAVRKLIAASDVVLAIGTEFGATDYDANEDGGFHIPGTLIRIDIDPQQMVRSQMPELGLVGDARQGVLSLLQLLRPLSTDRPANTGAARARSCIAHNLQTTSTRDKHYLALLDTVSTALPGVCITGDSTQIIYAGNTAFTTQQPNCYFNSSTGFGTLGYALPAAIGAALADPAQAVVAIAGDGGLQFTIAELATAVEAGVQVTLLVHQNGGYGEIRRFMTNNGVVPVGVDLMSPDFTMVAHACGWRASRLRTLDSLGDELQQARRHPEPTLLLLDDSIFE